MIAAGLLSVVWLVAGLGFLFISQAPSDCHESDRILCLAAGEFGSYLQGLFAPVAFIWLVAAVWIQSKELGHQREELRLTRTEFEYNREVMKSQAEEARRQAEFVGQQTEAIKKANANAEAEAVFQAHVSTLATRFRQYLNALRFYLVDPAQYNSRVSYAVHVNEKNLSDENDQTLIASVTNALRTSSRPHRKAPFAPSFEAEFPEDFMRLYAAAEKCAEAAKLLPPALAVRAQALELDDLLSYMSFLRQCAFNLHSASRAESVPTSSDVAT
jgi:membrane-bound lytic murein transglycosylase